MKIFFEKWHANLNNFIVVLNESLNTSISQSLQNQAHTLCSTNGSGIGADGILLLEPTKTASYRLTIINQDGTTASHCGNGVCCAAYFIRNHHKSSINHVKFLIEDRQIQCDFIGNSDPWVHIRMGSPTLNANLSIYQPDFLKNILKQHHVKFKYFGFCDLGNNHIVIYTQENMSEKLVDIGEILQDNPQWDGINVHLASPFKSTKTLPKELGEYSNEGLSVKPFERGVGLTAACGSGACSAYALYAQKEINSYNKWLPLQMPGGTVYCRQSAPGKEISMLNKAKKVFAGNWEL